MNNLLFPDNALEKTEHAGTASGVEKCLKMAIGLKNTAIDYQIVAF